MSIIHLLRYTLYFHSYTCVFEQNKKEIKKKVQFCPHSLNTGHDACIGVIMEKTTKQIKRLKKYHNYIIYHIRKVM